MALVSKKKQKWERPVIAGDFTEVLGDGESLLESESTIKAVDSDGNDVSTTFLDQATYTVDGAFLKIRTLDGENNKIYFIHFRAETSLGNRWETDMKITIKEVGTAVVTTTTTV